MNTFPHLTTRCINEDFLTRLESSQDSTTTQSPLQENSAVTYQVTHHSSNEMDAQVCNIYVSKPHHLCDGLLDSLKILKRIHCGLETSHLHSVCLLSTSLLKVCPFWRVFPALLPTTTLSKQCGKNLPPGAC